MDSFDNSLCCSCLNSDRKMILVDEFHTKQCFLQIIRETQMSQLHENPVWLCWECEALIRRFARFKNQVKTSTRILQEYPKENIHLLHKKSHLCIQNLVNLSLNPDTKGSDEVKSETVHPAVLKAEPKMSNKVQTELKDIEELSSLIKVKDEIDVADDASIPSDHCGDEDYNTPINTRVKRRKMRKTVNGTKKKSKTPVAQYIEIELTAEEIEEERKALTMREEYCNAMYRCEQCIVSFPNADDLRDHVAKSHDLHASGHICRVCACSFAGEAALQQHARRHTVRRQCCACAARHRTRSQAARHYKDNHFKYRAAANDYLPEQACRKSVISTKDEASFPCEFCHKTFRWKTSLRKHAETHKIETGQKRKPYCEPCRLTFTTTANLQKHVKTSSKHQIQLKLRKLKESLPEHSTSVEKQKAHIEEIKSSVNSVRQRYACVLCDKKFQWRGNMLRHMNSHAARAKGELVCEPCNRTFSSIATYKQHMKISKKHVTENDFKYMCSECGKRFANKTRLSEHVDWEHLKNYVHKCLVCQKVFKSHTSLYLHNQVHKRDSAELLCDHCGKSFPTKTKLRNHTLAVHTTQAPYKCGECAARFSWHSCLSRHVRRVHKARDKPPE